MEPEASRAKQERGGTSGTDWANSLGEVPTRDVCVVTAGEGPYLFRSMSEEGYRYTQVWGVIVFMPWPMCGDEMVEPWSSTMWPWLSSARGGDSMNILAATVSTSLIGPSPSGLCDCTITPLGREPGGRES